jgi:hypothetical protein
MRRWKNGLALASAATLCAASVASASNARTVIEFDPAAGEFPEGVTAAGSDEVYASLSGTGPIIEVGTDGGARDLVGLSLTDSAEGTVWRAEWQGLVGWVPVERRIADPLLEGTGELPFPFPVGANGVAVRDGVVHVGVSEQSHIVGVPVLSDGSAGEPFVDLALPGITIDGIAITAEGDFVIAEPPANTIWLVGSDGVPVVAADASDEISGPTSVYVDASLDDQPVYVANMAQAVVGGWPIIHRASSPSTWTSPSARRRCRTRRRCTFRTCTGV